MPRGKLIQVPIKPSYWEERADYNQRTRARFMKLWSEIEEQIQRLADAKANQPNTGPQAETSAND